MYWKGLAVAVAIDLAWIMGGPFLATGPDMRDTAEPRWVLNDNVGMIHVGESGDVEKLNQIGDVEDSLMMYVQAHPEDVDAIQHIAELYADHGWWDQAIDPLARALQLDPERRSLWSALDGAVEKSGKDKITDRELTERAAAFVEAVDMWGEGC